MLQCAHEAAVAQLLPLQIKVRLGRLHQPQDEQQDTRGSQDGPGEVEVRESRAVPLTADQPDGRAEDGHADGREYEKGPAPARSLNEQTAEERTNRSEPDHRPPG